MTGDSLDALVALYRHSEFHRRRAGTGHIAGGAGRCVVCGVSHPEDCYPPPRQPWIRVGPRPPTVKAHHAGVGFGDFLSLYWEFTVTYWDSRWTRWRFARGGRR